MEFFVCNLEKLAMPHKFDQIVLVETLEHFIPAKIPIILNNLSNILKKDGKLIITVPSNNMPLKKKHYQYFAEESLAKTIGHYFQIVEISGFAKGGSRRMLFKMLRKRG